MLKKNDVLNLSIAEQGKTGDGIGFVDDIPIYIPNTALGDRVEIVVTKVEKRRAYGKCREVLAPGEDRVMPPCPVSGPCGGCQLQHLSYDAQIKFKEQLLRQRLSRFLDLNSVLFRPLVHCDSPLAYRNKMQFSFSLNKEDVLEIGLYAARSHHVVDAPSEGCALMPKPMNTVLEAIRIWHANFSVPIFDELSGTGIMRHVMIRYSDATKQLMVVLTVAKRFDLEPTFIEAMQTVKGLHSLYLSLQPDHKEDAVLGKDLIFLAGKDHISDEVLGLSCRVSPRSFMQGNSVLVPQLYQGVLDALDGAKTVLDLYCGSGLMSMAMAKTGASVLGIDDNPSAIDDAQNNVKDNFNSDGMGRGDVDFKCMKVETYLKRVSIDRSEVSVLLDPPRRGCDPEVLKALMSNPPERVVMLSCSIDTLGRDLRILCEGGFSVEFIQGYDMFCQTPHLEVLVRLKVSSAA